MKIDISAGYFQEFGARIEGRYAVFTFEVHTDAVPYIHLYQKSDKKEIAVIAVDDTYRFGRVYSVRLKGAVWKDVCYLLERDKSLGMDEYAAVVYGREKWMDETRVSEHYITYSGFTDTGFHFRDEAVEIAPEDMVIYKLHMRGFTMQNFLAERKCGNWQGLLQRLPYFKELGITSLEFMPLYDFEEIRYRSHYEVNPKHEMVFVTGKPMGTNYWGYGAASYFAPKASYFGGDRPDVHMKEMVRGIHRAGLEVIMEISYVPEVSDDLIIDNLIYWVREYHIDGFHLVGQGLPIERIAKNALLGDTKLIHDNFPDHLLGKRSGLKKRLFVTNDGFAYPVRRLQNHLDGTAKELANVMRRQGDGYGYINYAASNTGFTLWDAFSYGEKHNEANGEHNADGSNYNCSHNHGCEGETASKVINQSRMTAMRTAFAILLLSQGVPMVFAGDEVANTQYGNNNPYCQDNEIGWTTFSRKKIHKQLRDYFRALIGFRKAHPILRLQSPLRLNDYRHTGIPDVSYHGREPWVMGIGDEKKALGILLNGFYGSGEEDAEDVMICFNFYFGEETFALPRLAAGRKWYFVTNTSDEAFREEMEILSDQSFVVVRGGTLTILVGKTEKSGGEDDEG